MKGSKKTSHRKVLIFLIALLFLGIGGAGYAVFGPEGGESVFDVVAGATGGGTADGDEALGEDGEPLAEGEEAGKKKRKRKAPGPAPASIAADVRGKVALYRTKEPVAGLEVTLVSAEDDEWQAETDGAGRFRFTGLAPAAGYRITAKQEPYASIELGLDLGASESRDIGTLWLDVPVNLEVTVFSLKGVPVPDAAVSVFSTGVTAAGAAADENQDWEARILSLTLIPKPTKAGTTDENGKAIISGLMPGTYRVTADADGMSSESRQGVVVAPDAAAAPVKLLLGPGHELDGRVLDPDEKAVPAARIIAIKGSTWNPGAVKWMADSDEKGAYKLAGLPAGRVTLYLAREGKPHLQVGSFGIPDTKTYDIRLRPGGTIKGTVTDEDGKPIAEADIKTAIQTSWSPMSTQTDAEGNFEMLDVPAGALAYFTVNKDGYMPYPNRNAPQQGSGESLREGATMVREVVLRRGLSATLTFRTTEDNSPVADADVRLYIANQWGWGAPWKATTNDQGVAEVKGLVAGEFLVTAKKPGYVQLGIPPNFRTMLRSSAAIPEEWKLSMSPDEAATGEYKLAQGASVSGRVIDGMQQAVAGAQVTVQGTATDFPVFTDAEGRWQIVGVTPRKRLTATAKAPGKTSGTSEPFQVDPGGTVEDIEIALKVGGIVTGNVRSADGAPLHGAIVRWVKGKLNARNSWSFNQFNYAEKFPVTETGRFEITDVDVGDADEVNITVRADAEGMAPAWNNTVVVRKNQETGGIDLILTTELQIAGRVESRSGEPIAGASVGANYRGKDKNARWYWGGQVTGLGGQPTAQTDDEGQFILKGLTQGFYDIWAQAPEFASGTRVRTETGAGDVLVTLNPGKSISGIVKDDQGKPIGGVPVAANKTDNTNREGYWWWGSSGRVFTAPDGTFELRSLSEGTYTLKVSAQWTWGRDVNVEDTELQGVTAGRDDVDIIVRSGGIIEGYIVDWNGKRVNRGWIYAQFQAGNGSSWRDARWGEVRPDGTFKIVGLRAGSYTISAYGSFSFESKKGVATGSKDLKIEVKPGFIIQGQIIDADGMSVNSGIGVRVRRSGESNWGWRQVLSPGDGTFIVTGLDEGGWDLEFKVGSFAPREVLNVTAGTEDMEVSLVEGLELTGFVVDTGDNPVSGVWINVYQLNVPPGSNAVRRSGRSGSDGKFKLTGLPAGEYRLSARKSPFLNYDLPQVAAGTDGQKIVMDPGSVISGFLVDPHGNPIASGSVSVRDGNGKSVRSAGVKSDGSFTVTKVPSGGAWTLYINARVGDKWVRFEHFELVASGSEGLEIEVVPPDEGS